MLNNYKIVCVIPARGGSKGVPRKNIRNLAGKPLIGYAIEQSQQSQYIDRTIVSTEDMEIAAVSKHYGAELPFVRPVDLADDHTSTIDVLLHSINWLEENEKYDFQILVLLHATTPLRSVKDIDLSIEKLIETNAENVFSVTEAHRNPYFNMVEINNDGQVMLVKKGDFNTRQSAPIVYDMNSSIYVWWKDILKEKKKIILERTEVYVMPKNRSVDIDDSIDFTMAEVLLKERIERGKKY